MNMHHSFILLVLMFRACFTSIIDDKLIKLIISPGLQYSEKILLNEDNIGLVSPAKTTVFLIHGWLESSDKSIYGAVFDAYNKKGGYNVIRVDWNAYSHNEYLLSATLIKHVGYRVARYIKMLNANGTGVCLSKIHIVGHSLGAHASGFAGKYVKELLHGSLARITGLDPAGPKFGLFLDVPPSERLSSDDADMVDVLYTNRGEFGTANEIGLLNFYANDAFFQPGCPFFSLNLIELLLCSHQRSVRLFTESINTDQFIAYQIDSMSYAGPVGVNKGVKVIFGENTNGIIGRYHFNTNCKPPYAVIQPNCIA